MSNKPNVIISKVIGGLGNQMFQYAAGRALSLAHNVPFYLDIIDFNGYGLHQGFELARIFSCPVALAEPAVVQKVLGWQASRKIRRIIARPILKTLHGRNLVVEPHYHYWAGINNVLLPCYLMGHWQSERYFIEVTQIIKNDFTFKLPLDNTNLKLAQEIASVSSVSIHVRRGDYMSNKKTLSTHGLCPLSYYESAMNEICKHIKNPHFFVFSDDVEWVQKSLKINHPCRYIDNNQGKESYNDMRLMSLCKHNIIANSTFSWWGAWLNNNADKMVVAPQRWFANDTKVMDLFPSGWLLI
jgi:hypothetical protein